jgi:hypothetical protein
MGRFAKVNTSNEFVGRTPPLEEQNLSRFTVEVCGMK